MDNPHKGHRQRMRDRFLNDPKNFADHEMLELLLYYAIPRRDTNELAHDLIARFSTLKGVLLADVEELCMVNGISKSTAVLIRSVAELANRYYTEKTERPAFYTMAESSEYIVNMLYGSTVEEFHVFCLDAGLKLIGHKQISKGDVTSVSVKTRMVVQTAINMSAQYVILAHNHPGGSPQPSMQDIEMTQSLNTLLAGVGVKVCDHIITSGRRFYAFSKLAEFSIDDEKLMILGEMYDE
ncbi:MAG: DNA repair protein RadC [Christensenellaceae bacterium]|nr:DNA repair protein RadC [Christensenellaceae bacterium]